MIKNSSIPALTLEMWKTENFSEMLRIVNPTFVSGELLVIAVRILFALS